MKYYSTNFLLLLIHNFANLNSIYWVKESVIFIIISTDINNSFLEDFGFDLNIGYFIGIVIVYCF